MNPFSGWVEQDLLHRSVHSLPDYSDISTARVFEKIDDTITTGSTSTLHSLESCKTIFFLHVFFKH